MLVEKDYFIYLHNTHLYIACSLHGWSYKTTVVSHYIKQTIDIYLYTNVYLNQTLVNNLLYNILSRYIGFNSWKMMEWWWMIKWMGEQMNEWINE